MLKLKGNMKEIIEKDLKEFFNGSGRKKNYIGDLIAIKTRKLNGSSLYIDKSTIKFKLVPDPEYGIIKTRFRTSYHGDFKIAIGTERNFDTLLILGLNKVKGIIEKVFAIPAKYLGDNKAISILKTGKLYQTFKIDEKPYNKIYNHLKTGQYSILEDGDITKIRENDQLNQKIKINNQK